MQRWTRHAATIWFVAVGALPVAEGLALAVAYDAAALDRLPRGWSPLLRGAPIAMPFAAAVATAALLLVGPRVRLLVHAISPALTPRMPLFLLAHLVAFAGLFLACGVLFADGGPVPGNPGAWVAACGLLAVASAATWLAALVPPPMVRALMRETWGPLLLSVAVGGAAWALGRWTLEWGATLRDPTMLCAARVLRLWEPLVRADGGTHVIGTPSFLVQISPECSGYEGVGLVWAFLAAYFWIFRRQLRFPRVLLLIPLATLAVWCLNVLRIAVLVTIGSRASAKVALGGFHSYAGSLLFCGTALVCAAVAHDARFFARRNSPARTDADSDAGTDPEGAARGEAAPSQNPAAPYLVPFLAVVAAGLVTATFSASNDSSLYAVRLVVAAVALWLYRAPIRAALGQWDGRGAALAAAVGVPTAAACLGLWLATVAGAPAVLAPGAFDPSFPASGWIVARCVGALLVAPIIEELAFRGYLARRLMSADFNRVPLSRTSAFAVAASSVLFAALHSQFAGGLVAGLAYALVARRRGRLLDAVVAHAATNAVLLAYALRTGAWSVLG